MSMNTFLFVGLIVVAVILFSVFGDSDEVEDEIEDEGFEEGELGEEAFEEEE